MYKARPALEIANMPRLSNRAMMRESKAKSGLLKPSTPLQGRMEDSNSDSTDEYEDSGQEYSDDDSDFQEFDDDPEFQGLDHGGVPFAFDPNPQVSLDLEDDSALAAVDEQMRQFEHKLGTHDDNASVNEDELHNGNIYPPEFYQQSIATFDPNAHRATVYAPKTQAALDSVEKSWRLFCEDVMHTDDWKGCLADINFAITYNFLKWCLCQRTTANGRRKRAIKSKQTLTIHWMKFRLVYERHFFRKINDRVDSRQMRNGLAHLRRERALNHNPRVNRSMTIEDLKLQIETTLRTTERSFKLGEARVLAVLFLLLLAPHGSRPGSILALQYKHIEIVLLREPEDPKRAPRLAVRLSLEFTKTYLGEKAEKMFTVPEVMFDPSLTLSPHVFLLAILFRRQAFDSNLNTDGPHGLSELQIKEGENELPIYLKPELSEEFIFRRVEKTISGYQMSRARISSHAMCKTVSTIGVLAGFEHPTISYSLRYMAGNNMDQDANVSEFLMQSVMGHGFGSVTFGEHYLNRHVCMDGMAIQRGTQQQQALLKQATSHGSSVSSRRPTKLSATQKAGVREGSPLYQNLTLRLQEFPKRTDEHRRIQNQRKALVTRLEREELVRVRKAWKYQQSKEDINQQLKGQSINSSATQTTPLRASLQRAIDGLDAPLIPDVSAQFRRRADAIIGLVNYCAEEEPVVTKLVEQKALPPAQMTSGLSPEEQMDDIKNSTLVKHTAPVLRCFICVAKALHDGMDHPNFVKWSHQFANTGTLRTHFLKHIDLHGSDDSFDCPICNVHLIHKQHLQNHAELIHGISTENESKRLPRNIRRY